MSLKTPLNKVLGLGSAKSGVEHWWVQRLTAAGLVPLGLWFAVSLMNLEDFSYISMLAWLNSPVQAILLTLLAVTVTYHSHLGVQVVIEDYVHGKASKVLSLVLSSFAHILVGVALVFSILKVAFGAI